MEFVRGRDRFFDPLVAFLCNYTCVSLALEAQQKGIVTQWGPGDRIAFNAPITGHVIAFATAPILDAVSRGDWVDTLPFEEHPVPEKPPEKKIPRTGRVHQLSAQALFVQFYDSVDDLAEANHNDPLVRFCKAIRNACAHGGVFTKLDDRALLVWKTLALREADNGKTLLQLGINPGDLIALMRELDARLR